MPCTDPIIATLAPFRPVFTAPTWKHMMTLLKETVLARGHRTVTAALWQTGHQQDPHFSAFHVVRATGSFNATTVTSIPSASQQWKRERTAGAPGGEALLILAVQIAIRGRLIGARDLIIDSAPILAVVLQKLVTECGGVEDGVLLSLQRSTQNLSQHP